MGATFDNIVSFALENSTEMNSQRLSQSLKYKDGRRNVEIDACLARFELMLNTKIPQTVTHSDTAFRWLNLW